MKKPTLEAALARKVPEADAAPPPAVKPKAGDGKLTTSLRIEPARLEALKIIAFRERVRVNDLVLEGIDHVLALRRQKAGQAA
jgi:hypothetical protein